jgi:hypothetical protein
VSELFHFVQLFGKGPEELGSLVEERSFNPKTQGGLLLWHDPNGWWSRHGIVWDDETIIFYDLEPEL